MTTSAVTAAASTTPGNTVKNPKGELKAEDFIKMMITQLQNQDPMEPAKNEQLLAQMSQIGQLESATQLQSSLSKLVLQNNLGAAGNLIGKQVQGLGDDGDDLGGEVTSVRVEAGDVYLELDTGSRLRLDRVTEITDGGAGAAVVASQ